MLIYEGNVHKKNGVISQLGAERITFPPKPDIQTDRQTYRHTYKRTDISVYRVASLLKTYLIKPDDKFYSILVHLITKNQLNYMKMENLIQFPKNIKNFHSIFSPLH